MRVLLVTPFALLQPTLWMPLGLPFMAARLRQDGHEAAVFDRFALQASLGRSVEAVDAALQARIETFRPDLIGLSTLSPLIHDTVRCATTIRQGGFRGLLLAGGYHATALPELTLRKIPELDAVLAGEGEEVLASLAGGAPLSSLPGMWARRGDALLAPEVPAAQVACLDDLPLPAFDVMDMDFYSQRNDGVIRRHNLRSATVISSRGCQYRCRFCAESVTFGGGVRFHSAPYLLEWMQKLVRDYAIEGIHFHDNDFLTDEGRIRDFCAGLQRLGLHTRLRWGIQTRADRLSLEMVRLLKQSGCVLVEIGVEVGTQAELDHLRKRTTVDATLQAVRTCRRAGLDVHAYMLQRTEDESIEMLERRLAWLKRADPTSFQWSEVQMFPGTPLYQEKGGDFFASNAWDEAAVTGFYASDHFRTIPKTTRQAWMRRRFRPFARWHWWRHALRRYPWPVLFRHALRKGAGKVQRFFRKGVHHA